ncbi:MAG TPA: hypothetical protein VF711_09025, partial [Acidimicrobiales bacterium]
RAELQDRQHVHSSVTTVAGCPPSFADTRTAAAAAMTATPAPARARRAPRPAAGWRRWLLDEHGDAGGGRTARFGQVGRGRGGQHSRRLGSPAAVPTP